MRMHYYEEKRENGMEAEMEGTGRKEQEREDRNMSKVRRDGEFKRNGI